MSVSACAVSQHEGGDNTHGEESQGREEEGRQEAVTSPVRKKGGGRRPLFTFLPHLTHVPPQRTPSPDGIIHRLHRFHRWIRSPRCHARTPIADTTSCAGREAAGRARSEPCEREPPDAAGSCSRGSFLAQGAAP